MQAQVLDLLTVLCRENETALVLVTHDLAIVASRCQRIAVMYGGRIIEIGPASQIVHAPQHPYTVGLLAARPRLEGDLPPRLASIPGTAVPPSRPLAEGCAFAPRCPLATAQCRTSLPTLDAAPHSAGGDHQVACWRAGTRPDFTAHTAESPTERSHR